MSLSVRAGRLRSASGILIPLLFDNTPPSVTSVWIVSPRSPVTRSANRPSSRSSASPTLTSA